MRRIAVLVAVIVVGLVGGVYSMASASTTSEGSDNHAVIHLTEKGVQFKELDLGGPVLSLGDEFVFSSNLLDDASHVVGRDGGFCTIVRVDASNGDAHCTATLILGHDQLTAQGIVALSIFTQGGRFTNAITGGTGRFRHAHGELQANQLNATTAEFALVLH